MSSVKVHPGNCTRRRLSFSIVGASTGIWLISTVAARAGDEQPGIDVLKRGAAIFATEWMPKDPKGTGGDGLGPVYNETSCIACHHQGGPGGAGPASSNVEILTARPG